MRRISAAEMLQLRELLQMETNAIAKAKAVRTLIKDDELAALADTGIQNSEARIKGIQQCLIEGNIIEAEVH